jgi:Outer membrane protein beta-barrel domain
MKRTAAKILCVVLAIWDSSLYAQDRAVRFGFQVSPLTSWIKSNDKLIVQNGGNVGLKLGTTADIYFKDNYSFTLGFDLGFKEGGEFLYEIGGNFLPESELSDQILQTGDKPLPDGVKIRYNLTYLEFPVGFKIRTREKETSNMRYFLEAPVFTFSFLTRGRGDIETDDAIYEAENIYKDMSVINIFWGLGAGFEYSISQNNALVGGIYYQKGFFDITRDEGWRSIINPGQDPNDPTDDYLKQTEDSKASIGNLVLRLGIIF